MTGNGQTLCFSADSKTARPLTLQNDEGSHHPAMNYFTYGGDIQGAKSPFYAHIPKTNPRGSGESRRLLFLEPTAGSADLRPKLQTERR